MNTLTLKGFTAELISMNEKPAIQFSWKGQKAWYDFQDDAWGMLKGMISAQKVQWDTLKEMFADFISEVRTSLETHNEVQPALDTIEDIRAAGFARKDALQAEYAHAAAQNPADLVLLKSIQSEYKKITGQISGINRLKVYLGYSNERGVADQVRNSGERRHLHERYVEMHQELKEMLLVA